MVRLGFKEKRMLRLRIQRGSRYYATEEYVALRSGVIGSAGTHFTKQNI